MIGLLPLFPGSTRAARRRFPSVRFYRGARFFSTWQPARRTIRPRVPPAPCRRHRIRCEPWHRYVTLRYARTSDITSGIGAGINGGRWNAPGTFPTVYGALTSAIAHAEQVGFAKYARIPEASLLPRLLVAIDVKGLDRVLDLTDAKVRRELKVTARDITTEDWRAANLLGEEALTQAIGRAAHAAGFQALHVPSAPTRRGRNVVVFPGRTIKLLSVQKGDEINRALR